MSYLHDPAAIYEESFRTIRNEADLSRFSADEKALVIRLIHACGMVDVAEHIEISDNGVGVGMEAIASGAPIICDVNMVAKGIISRRLVAKNQILCGLNLARAKKFATDNDHTRSAGGIEALSDDIEGAVIAIGNAPTALFHLLEMIENGIGKPAIILGFPVGFVGAVESKAELAANRFDIPFVTLLGRRGGSAFAAAAVNALAFGLKP